MRASTAILPDYAGHRLSWNQATNRECPDAQFLAQAKHSSNAPATDFVGNCRLGAERASGRRPCVAFPLRGIAVSEAHHPTVTTVTALDNSPRLSPEQQAPLVAKLQEAEFRESDMSSDLLGAGLWIAYAVLAAR